MDFPWNLNWHDCYRNKGALKSTFCKFLLPVSWSLWKLSLNKNNLLSSRGKITLFVSDFMEESPMHSFEQNTIKFYVPQNQSYNTGAWFLCKFDKPWPSLSLPFQTCYQDPSSHQLFPQHWQFLHGEWDMHPTESYFLCCKLSLNTCSNQTHGYLYLRLGFNIVEKITFEKLGNMYSPLCHHNIKCNLG